MSAAEAARRFFATPRFAVVGASSDPTKFGHQSTFSSPYTPLLISNIVTVFTWYTHHSLPVTPINPSSPHIKAYPAWPSLEIQTYPTLPNLSALPSPTDTAVSIITPPKVTRKVLEEAKSLGIKAVWLQPGSFDDEILSFAKKEFESGVGGDGGAGSEGWCVLVDGEKAMKDAGRQELKL